MNPKGTENLQFFGTAPHVIVTDGPKAVVVGHKGIEFEHEIKVKKGLAIKDLQFIDGELFVVQGKGWGQTARYWSSAPMKVQKEWYNNDTLAGFYHHREGCGTFTGEGTTRAGDKEIGSGKFFADGEHYWTINWDDKTDARVIKEIDTDSGKVGRNSMPAFFEDFIKTGKTVDQENSHLLPYGDLAKTSPLGSKDGLVGWRVRYDIDKDHEETRYYSSDADHKNLECEGIDGRKWKGLLNDRVPIGLMDWPGSTEHRVLLGEVGWSWGDSSNCELWDSQGEFELVSIGESVTRYCSGQATCLPPLFWHMYEARDEKSSKKLRSVNAKQAKVLLQAMTADRESLDDDAEDDEQLPSLPKTKAAIKKWLTTLKDKRFSMGIQGLVYQAVTVSESLEDLIDSRDPDSDDPVADAQQEACVDDAMECLGVSTGWGDRPALFPHLANVKSFLVGEREAGPISPGPFNWGPLLDDLDTQVYASYWSKQKLDPKLAEFLEHWAAIGLFELPGSFRYYEGEFTGKVPFPVKKKRKRDDNPPWMLYEHKGNKFICWQESHWDENYEVIEYAPKGKFQVLPAFSLENGETECSRGQWTGERMQGYITAFQERELPLPDKQKLKDSAARINVTHGELGLFWFGLVNIDSWETNFLPKPLREHLGLKVKETTNAKQAVKGLKSEFQTKLLAALMNGPAEDLWADGGQRALERLLVAWSGSAPKRLDVPADLLKTLDDISGYGNTTEYIAALADPKKSPYLKSNATWQMGGGEDEGKMDAWCSADETFDDTMLKVATLAIPLICSKLPGGSAAAKTMADVFAQTNKCLNKPGLIFSLVSRYFWGKGAEEKKLAHNLLKQLVGKMKVSKGVASADNGLICATADDDSAYFGYRPAKVKTAKDHERVMNIMTASRGSDAGHEEPVTLSSSLLIRSDGYKAIIERIKKGDMTDGAYDSNPLISASSTVTQVAKKKKLSEEAAAYYLQLLTLHDPTSANVKLWNDWTTATINKAGKELLGKKLILDAKRARAGRTHFIPGGWETLKIPNLPLETWKLPLYDIGRDAETGKLTIPLERIVPLRPLPDLFAAAWKRVLDGDEPKYDEVK
jgi:hypothetical protein